MKKYQHYIDVRGKFVQLHAAQRQLLPPLNNPKKTIFQKYREPRLYENSSLGFIKSDLKTIVNKKSSNSFDYH